MNKITKCNWIDILEIYTRYNSKTKWTLVFKVCFASRNLYLKIQKINYVLWWLTKKYALETFSNFTYIPHGKYNVSRPYRYSELFCEIHQKCFTMNILYYASHAHYSLFQQQIYITTSSVYCFLRMAIPKEFIIYWIWPS